jgi:acetyl-CoA acetyltransferase/uncharacterized OB-fold protein
LNAGFPLPALSLETAFFWTAGRSGLLQFRHCRQCDAYIHPPRPACPYCRSRSIDTRAVSGSARVVAFSVNHHQWLAIVPTPYIVVVVALEEDPRLRFTSNLVKCDPEEVTIGLPVKVCFERRDDVWMPLFEPAGGPIADPIGDDEPVAPFVRPPTLIPKLEHRVCLSGVGKSRLGRRLMKPPLELAVDACLEAISDAGLSVEDIDGLSTYPGARGGGHDEGGINAVEESLRIRPTWFNGGAELPGQSGLLTAAMLAVASGLCRHVLCFRTVWDATYSALARPARSIAGRPERVDQGLEWRVPFAGPSVAPIMAMYATRYLHRFGGSRETLGRIALNARANAARNPAAIYREPLTMEDYLSARVISTPFGLYDCDVPCDGAIAVVVSSVDAATDTRQPVFVDAVGTQIAERMSWDQGALSIEPNVRGPAAHMWSRSSLRPREVDVALLYDGFTFNCLSWIEALGFCGFGEGVDFLDDPRRIGLDGDLPLNPHGGQLSEGRTHGLGFVFEAVTQLRGGAGDRQVAEVTVAVASSGGGGSTSGGCILLTADDPR